MSHLQKNTSLFDKKIVVPSIFGSNLLTLLETVKSIDRQPNIHCLHFDIMDGHFVPNLSFGPEIVHKLRMHSNLFFDVHLMIDNPEKFIEIFAKAGADLITIHAEAVSNPRKVIEQIHNLGCFAGLAINPNTDVKHIYSFLEFVDLVLVMSVNPGFCSQAFEKNALEKIKFLSDLKHSNNLQKFSFCIEVDGGIDVNKGQLCLKAGANWLVSGSGFFNSFDKHLFVSKILGVGQI